MTKSAATGPTRAWRQAWRALIAAVLVAAALASSALALEASEPAIKAAYLYKFGFFVEWPQAAFAASDSPINLCIVGNDPFGTLLDDTVKGQKIGNRPISVHRMTSVSRDSGCHIAYLPDGAQSPSAQAVGALRGSDILTVTDAGTGGSPVGIINFVIKDNRVRFDIDDAAAASSGLVISSRLLSLALEVKPRQ
jgi:YfiR/HmsC-like